MLKYFGLVSYYKQQHEKALEYLDEAKAILISHFGVNHLQISYIYRTMANIKRCQSKYVESISYFESALKILESQEEVPLI